MSILVVTLTLIIGYLAIVFIQKRKAIVQHLRIRRALEQFPCPPKHWLLGNLVLLGKPDERHIQLKEHYVKSFKTCSVYWLSIFPILSINHSKAAKAIIKASVPKGSWIYAWVRPWLGRGLIFENGNRWKRNRRLLTPSFHYERLQSYLTVFNQCTDTIIQKWTERSQNNQSFNEFEDLTLLSFDSLLQCAFSVKIHCQTSGKNHPYVAAIHRLTRLITDRAFTLLHYIEWIYRLSSKGREFSQLCHFVHQFVEEIIEKRKKELENQEQNNRKEHYDFLDVLLTGRDEDGNGLTVQEIRDEVDTFMFAGHDTTASALSWTFYCLAKYPHYQEKVRREVDVFMSHKNDVEWNDLSEMNYTTMCIKEALRLYTVVPVVERRMDQDMIIDGKLVPSGTIINLELYCICHREESWPNPNDYDPDRFSIENINNRDAFEYLPFSAGQRNCIGQQFAMNEIKVVVAKIIHHFYLEIDPNYDVKPYHSIVNQTETGLWIKAKKRYF
ncbi:uncharacterized protein TRIADDRAFT_31445 [Trichoplax adhaerens]|uniref:Cytochrome P450 n=1 Tax=Trichoplax adhaerens TaxID=10228 RepID=B3S933_TRIAD|nr:hypothetical protein TRIADDRAFT_31445 [Trichoplax adhaerens]EDV20731.1 hypothetical protein TRIADDRAFT_31445 [Trichoplax adhaerens]|eukprot:XP_002116672.1 hypothetical protein TRIADDRAFT_31445 [Trichoplax adhaerens]